jgi:O-antigen/teichoic acid export membrane protein
LQFGIKSFMFANPVRALISSKFKEHLAFSYITQFIVAIFGVLQIFLINKYYGIEVFGQLTIIISTVGILNSLATARSSEAVTKFFVIEKIKHNNQNAKFVLAIGMTIDFITAIILIAMVYFLANFLANFFLKDINLAHEIIIYAYITFFVFLRGTIIGYLQAKELFHKINAINIFDWSLRILFLFLFIFYLDWLTLKDIIYSLLFASIVSFFYALFIFINSYLPEFKGVKIQYNKLLFQKYLKFNLKTFISSSLKAGNRNIDNLILAFFLDSQVVGIYQTIKKILSPVAMLSIPFSMLIYPKLIDYFTNNKKLRFLNIIKKISLNVLFLGICYVMFALYFLEDLFIFMDVEFLNEYKYYFSLISVFTLISTITWWARPFSNVVNVNYSIYINIFLIAYQLSVAIYLVSMYGVIGLFVSLIAMYLIIYFYYLIKLNKYVFN